MTAGLPLSGCAQHLLDRVISLEVRGRPLGQVLDTIGRLGHFAFSYNSSILPGDSVVRAVFRRATVGTVLDGLLGKGYAYAEQENYLIILRPAEDQPVNEGSYQVAGTIVDTYTGRAIENATVYVKEQLQSALTDVQGAFKLRLRTRSALVLLTVSKEWYADTAVVVHGGNDQVLSIGITPVSPSELSPVFVSSSGFERSGWGHFFLSSRQRIQSLNLSGFFTSRPVQVSLLPWVGTHGRMSGQVTNACSLNLIGGYSAGVDGVELGGVFNIDKKDVRGVQAAGITNITGGTVRGVQVAGVFNYVQDSLRGVQVAGIGNVVKGNVWGIQIAAEANACKDTLRGVQLSTFENLAHILKGVQIGLINISDSSTGYSIGIFNYVKHGGVNRVSLQASEVTGLTVQYMGGNKKLNNILLAGYNPWSPKKTMSWGYGAGKTFSFSARWGLYGEVTVEELYDRRWTNLGMIDRFRPVITFKAARKIQWFAGPSLSLFVAAPKQPAAAGQSDIPGKVFWPVFAGTRTNSWIGVTAGISFF